MGLACQLSIQAATVAAGCALYWLYKRLSKPKSVKLTYFDVRATPGEKIRLALALSGTPFEDNRIKFADWPALKPKTKYGAMPFAEIDGVEYAQSGAILRWAGGLGDGSLYPSGMAERMKVEEMLGVSDDLQRAWTPAFYMSMKPEQFGYTKETAPVQKLREKFMKEEFGKFITFIENELKQTGAFVCGVSPALLTRTTRVRSG